MGFSLGGLSAITRDGSYDITFNDTTDHFSYNGQRLIPGSDGYYHTEKESFIGIELNNPNASNSHWVAAMKNGTKFYFGNTTDSHNVNYNTVEYNEDTINDDYYPVKFEYTKNDTYSLNKTRTVELFYEKPALSWGTVCSYKDG